MSLPARLWLPEGISEQVTVAPGAAAGRGLSGSGSTPVQRLRRRALWRGEAGLIDRAVLVEWFPATELERERATAACLRDICHVHLLRLLDLGMADARTAYAVSEAPDGVDLFTVLRAAPGELPSWWGLSIGQAVARALLAVEAQQSRRRARARGHGRVGQGTIFVGWDGSVRLFAFSPLGSAGNRQEESIAPELRLSERLQTPAADVYALGALLRQLLPSAAQRQPAIGRLLRRCLHPHPDQRIGLRALDTSLELLLQEQQAPLARTAGIGGILGQCCPRATSDLVDVDWGEQTGDGYPSLPPTLVPLSASTVPLSPTWLAQSPRRPPTTSPLAARLGLLALVVLGLPLLAWLLGPQLSPSRPPPLAAPAALPLPPLPPGPPALQALSLRPSSDSLELGGLRLLIEGVTTRGEQTTLQLRLSNPGPQPLSINLGELRLVARGDLGTTQAPQQAPQVHVGPGRLQRLPLAFPAVAERDAWLLTLPLRDSPNMQK